MTSARKDGSWSCCYCCIDMPSYATKCSLCNLDTRRGAGVGGGSGGGGGEDSWKCWNCETKNPESAANCKECNRWRYEEVVDKIEERSEVVKADAPTWACAQCTFANVLERHACEMCGGAAAAMSATTITTTTEKESKPPPVQSETKKLKKRTHVVLVDSVSEDAKRRQTRKHEMSAPISLQTEQVLTLEKSTTVLSEDPKQQQSVLPATPPPAPQSSQPVEVQRTIESIPPVVVPTYNVAARPFVMSPSFFPSSRVRGRLYLSVDIECEGKEHERGILAIGMVLGTGDGRVLATRAFCGRASPFGIDERTWKEFWIKYQHVLERIASEAVDDHIGAMYNWLVSLEKLFGPFGRSNKHNVDLHIVSDNPAYDIGRINLELYKRGYRTSLAEMFKDYVPTDDPTEQIRGLTADRRAQVKTWIKTPHTHWPVDDAMRTYEQRCGVEAVIKAMHAEEAAVAAVVAASLNGNGAVEHKRSNSSDEAPPPPPPPSTTTATTTETDKTREFTNMAEIYPSNFDA